jgi:hypothetical protein
MDIIIQFAPLDVVIVVLAATVITPILIPLKPLSIV